MDGFVDRRRARAALIVAGTVIGFFVAVSVIGAWSSVNGVMVDLWTRLRLGTPGWVADARRDVIAAVEKADFDETITDVTSNRADSHTIATFRYATYLDDKRNRVTVEAQLNADGFRGPAVTQEKPPRTTRIIAIGDSHTFGFGLSDPQPYPAQLAQLLNQRGHGRFEVLNLGCPGFNLVEKLDMLRVKGIPYHPDIVVLQYDGDDLMPQRFRIWEGQTLRTLLKQFVSQQMQDLDYPTAVQPLLGSGRNALVKKLGKPLLLTRMVERPLTELIHLSGTEGFRIILIGTWVAFQEEALLRRYALRHGFSYTDVVREVFHDHPYPISRYEAHFNSEGHALIAKKLYEIIMNSMRLEAAPSRPST